MHCSPGLTVFSSARISVNSRPKELVKSLPGHLPLQIRHFGDPFGERTVLSVYRWPTRTTSIVSGAPDPGDAWHEAAVVEGELRQRLVVGGLGRRDEARGRFEDMSSHCEETAARTAACVRREIDERSEISPTNTGTRPCMC